MRLLEDPPVSNPHVADHQQPEIAHERVPDPRVGDVLGRDVEPEVLALQSAAVGEFDLEVKRDPAIHHSSRAMPADLSPR